MWLSLNVLFVDLDESLVEHTCPEFHFLFVFYQNVFCVQFYYFLQTYDVDVWDETHLD